MMELLLVIIVVQLGFVLSRLPKKKFTEESFSKRWDRERKENAALIVSQLRELHGCACSFNLWVAGRIFAEAGSPTAQGSGIILDSDDEWVLIECPAPWGAKGANQRLFRIVDIRSVAEILG